MVETADTVLLHTDETTIKVLQDVLKKLSMSGGSSSADQIWCEVDKENALSFSQSDQVDYWAIIDARRRLKPTMDISNTLKFLAETIEKRALAFKDKIDRTALKHGIDSLPDELLLFLLSLSAPSFSEVQNLSQVCRRFERVLADSPRLWASFELCARRYSPEIVACISGSQELGLRVHFDRAFYTIQGSDQVPFPEDSVHALLSCVHRWEELRISDPWELEVHQKLQLPALRKISFDCALERPSIEYVSEWKMPNLEQVSTSNASLMPLFGQSLVNCQISFNKRNFSDMELCNFLDKYPSLQKLTLSITSKTSGDYSTHRTPVVLSKVDSLYLYVDAEMTALLKFVAFLNGSLVLECLSTMTISVVFNTDKDQCEVQDGWYEPWMGGPIPNRWNEHDWMDGFQRFMAKHRNLMDVCFRASSRLEKHVDTPTKLNFASFLNCSRLESITIAAPGCLLCFEGVLNYEARNLRTLRLHDCDLLEPGCLIGLQRDLSSIGTDLKRIEVMNCPLIDRETLVDIFPRSKVVFNSWL